MPPTLHQDLLLTPAVHKSSVAQHGTAGGREDRLGLAVALTCSCQWMAPTHPQAIVQCGAPWLTLGAMVLQLLIENTNVVYDWSYFIAWIGVGWTLISALLFSGASVCLRSEREREDAKNMAYLMPGNAAALYRLTPSQADACLTLRLPPHLTGTNLPPFLPLLHSVNMLSGRYAVLIVKKIVELQVSIANQRLVCSIRLVLTS